MAEVPALTELLRAVIDARREVDDTRRRQARAGSPVALEKQQELLSALEDYSTELARRGQPLPYRLRDEVAMYRSMFRPSRRD
jgi:hypothetical protein